MFSCHITLQKLIFNWPDYFARWEFSDFSASRICSDLSDRCDQNSDLPRRRGTARWRCRLCSNYFLTNLDFEGFSVLIFRLARNRTRCPRVWGPQVSVRADRRWRLRPRWPPGTQKTKSKNSDKNNKLGSGCDSVGRAVASDARGSTPVIGKLLYRHYLFTVNCFEKTKIKRAQEWPIKKIVIKCCRFWRPFNIFEARQSHSILYWQK